MPVSRLRTYTYPGLVALDHDGNSTSVVHDGRQQRRRRRVVIPQVMVNELKAPGELTRPGAQRNDGIRPLVIAGTQAAVIIGARAPGWHEHQMAFGIRRHHGPRIRRARLAAGVRQGIPRPALHAGPRVEGADDARRHLRALIVVDPRTDDDEVVDDRGWRGHVIRPRLVFRNITQAHDAAGSEIAARFAVCRIKRDEPRVVRRFEQSPTAALALAA